MTLPCTPHLRCCCGLRGNVAKLRLTSPTDLQHCTNGIPVIHLPPRSSSSILEGGHPARILLKSHGVWRSLVARFVRDEEAVGSNPATPTRVESQGTVQQGPGTFHIRFFLIFPPGINPPVGSLHLPIAPAPPPRLRLLSMARGIWLLGQGSPPTLLTCDRPRASGHGDVHLLCGATSSMPYVDISFIPCGTTSFIPCGSASFMPCVRPQYFELCPTSVP